MTKKQTMLELDSIQFLKFKRRYTNALKAEDPVFVFEGQEILVDYAAYVIEYYKLKKEGKKT